ncbi:hypothetical protein IWW39_000728 [Coemansia spiralis]|uniref:FAM86 N-terminal domain-containing protein n=1 Tax=Coemansia spiralis TaxID=417178 RepID=A0A9W8L665_9FUNG|nr:hypothetical protein IWW39_000728 [Coemansia spiralis]
MRKFIWGDWESTDLERDENVALLACVRVQGEVMKTIIFHEHTTSYSPSHQYIVFFLKKYIEKIESMPNYDLDDELMEFYVSLAATTNLSAGAAGMCYKTYTLDKDQYTKVVLNEEQMMISQGTTGLQTWEASLRLADFFVEHPDIVRGQKVVELGAGCGLAGFACAAVGAAHVLSTDCSTAVLKLLEANRLKMRLHVAGLLRKAPNMVDPAFKDNVQVAELDWEHTDECAKLSDSADVVIGADITYDPTIVPVLVGALKEMVATSQQVAYITATIRNQETFDLFLQLVGKYSSICNAVHVYESGVLVKSVMDLSETKMTTLCHPNPMADIRLVLITRK